jgi:outer membrane protein W
MRRFSVVCLGFAGLCVTANAAAQERKFQLALRSGYSMPMGSAVGSGTVTVLGFPATIDTVKMGDNFSYRVPLWIDAGYMVTPNVMLGVYFQYGFVGVKSRNTDAEFGCSPGADCSGHDLHYGIQVQYYLTPGASVNPWLGFGVGRESMSLHASQQGQSTDLTLSGWTYALLQAGVDFGITDAFALGPFAAFSFGQYSTATVESGGISLDVDIPTAMHEWLTLGVKGQLGL